MLFKGFMSAVTILSMCCTLLCTAHVHAQEVKFDADTLKISIKRDTDSGQQTYLLTVLPSSKDPALLTAQEVNQDERVVYKTFVMNGSGPLSQEIFLPEDFAYGRYVAYLSGDGKIQMPFAVVDQVKLSSLLSEINTANQTELQQLIAVDGTELGLDDGTFAENSSEISSILVEARPDAGYTEKNFIDQYIIAEGAAALKAGRITVADFFQNYSGYIGDWYDVYAKESKATQEKVDFLIKDMDFSISSFAAAFDEVLFCGRMMGSQSGNAMKEILEKYYQENGIGFGNYYQLSDYQKSQVFSELFQQRKQMTTVTYIQTAFAQACSTKLPDAGNQRPSGGSGGGSAGGGGGGFVPGGTEVIGEAEKPDGTDIENESVVRFADLQGHWAENVVSDLYNAGVVNGYEDGSFRPENRVTRAEFTKMVVVAFGIEPNSGNVFADVNAEDWFAGYVYGAYQNDIIQGFNGWFEPYSDITRQDAAVILYRIMEIQGLALDGGVIDYADSVDIAEYATEAVADMSAAGIITGDENMFRPLDGTTRAEAAALISRVMKYIK